MLLLILEYVCLPSHWVSQLIAIPRECQSIDYAIFSSAQKRANGSVCPVFIVAVDCRICVLFFSFPLSPFLRPILTHCFCCSLITIFNLPPSCTPMPIRRTNSLVCRNLLPIVATIRHNDAVLSISMFLLHVHHPPHYQHPRRNQQLRLINVR